MKMKDEEGKEETRNERATHSSPSALMGCDISGHICVLTARLTCDGTAEPHPLL